MTTPSVEKLKVAVIGGGLGGLAAAARLARAGLKVTLFEKNHTVGGKLGMLEEEGFRWDIGCSRLLAPQTLRQLWADLGRDADSDFKFIKLDPSARWFWEDGKIIDQNEAFWKIPEIDKFLKNTEGLFEGVASMAMKRPITKIQAILEMHRLLLPRSLHTAVRREISDPYLVQILSRYASSTGSSPFKAPSALRVLAYMEATFGCWYVKGGMNKIVSRLAEICCELGVQFRVGEEVTALSKGAGYYKLATDGKWEKFRFVICNQDVLRSYQGLLPRRLNGAFRDSHLDRHQLSASGFMMFLGVKKRYSSLAQRNFFHSGDDASEFREIFEDHIPVTNPTIQVVASCRADQSHAPKGADNLLVMVNAPSIRPSVEWSEIEQAYGDQLIARLEKMGLANLSKNIVVRHQWTPATFRNNFNQCGGSLYGFASHDFQSSFLRPAMQPKQMRGFYFAGGSTNPGSGIPQVLISAEHAATRVLRDFKQ